MGEYSASTRRDARASSSTTRPACAREVKQQIKVGPHSRPQRAPARHMWGRRTRAPARGGRPSKGGARTKAAGQPPLCGPRKLIRNVCERFNRIAPAPPPFCRDRNQCRPALSNWSARMHSARRPFSWRKSAGRVATPQASIALKVARLLLPPETEGQQQQQHYQSGQCCWRVRASVTHWWMEASARCLRGTFAVAHTKHSPKREAILGERLQ